MAMETPITGHGQIGGLLPQGVTTVNEDRKLWVGMLLYMSTDVEQSIFFFAAWIWLRDYNTTGGWWHSAVGTASQGIGAVVLGTIVLGSLLWWGAQYMLDQGNQMAFKLLAYLGVFFALGSLAVAAWNISVVGFGLTDGAYADCWLLLTGYHIYHCAILLILTTGISVRANTVGYAPRHHIGMNLTTVYYFWAALYELGFWAMTLIQPAQIPK